MPGNRVQSASHTQTTSATSVAVTFAGNVQSGTKILCAFSADVNVTATAADGSGNNLTSCGSIGGSTGGAVRTSLFAMDTPVGDVGTKPTITVSWTGGATASALIQEVAGLAVGNTVALMLDGTAATVQKTTTASTTQPAYTSVLPNGYLVAVFGDNGGPETYTLPAGYAADVNNVNNNSSADVAIAYKNSLPGAESGTWTFTGTLTGAAFVVVSFKVAPPAPLFPAAGSAVVSGFGGRYSANHSR